MCDKTTDVTTNIRTYVRIEKEKFHSPSYWMVQMVLVQEVPVSDLGLHASYPKTFHGFTQSVQANARTVT